jgi:hypothetical protein
MSEDDELADDDETQLEQDFKEIQTKVNAKLREAAKAIREAQKIAKSKGMSLMTPGDDYFPTPLINNNEKGLQFAVDLIENAMDDAGWQSSSWNC